MAAETYIWHYMQLRGVELFNGEICFARFGGRLQHIYIHGDLCLTFEYF